MFSVRLSSKKNHVMRFSVAILRRNSLTTAGQRWLTLLRLCERAIDALIRELMLALKETETVN